MSRREELFDRVCNERIVGVVREDRAEDAWEVARTFVENGLGIIEITFTTPEATALITRLASTFGGRIVIAAGTIRSGNDAADARRAGAEVLVSPHTDLRVLEYALEHDLLSIPGAATATEVIRAWEASAGIVKIYPAPQLGGPDYIRALRQPIRDVPMLAGGPLTIDSIDSYLDAGAVAVNLGSCLARPELVRSHQWDEIGKNVAMALSVVRARRSETQPASLVH